MNGKKMRELREKKELTLVQLGERLGVSAAILSRIESGTKDPSISLLRSIASELGVHPGDLIDPIK